MIGILDADIYLLIPFGFEVLLSVAFIPVRNMLLLLLRRCDTNPMRPPGGFSADEPYFSANEKIFRFPFVMTTREGSSAVRRYLPGPIP